MSTDERAGRLEDSFVSFALGEVDVPSWARPGPERIPLLAVLFAAADLDASDRGPAGGAALTAADLAILLGDVAGRDVDDSPACVNAHVVPTMAALAALSPSVDRGDGDLEALVVGIEASVRLAEALHAADLTVPWDAAATTAGIGAALACSRILGLDHAHTHAALALVATQAPQFAVDLAPLERSRQLAWASACVVEAVFAAAEGVGGPVTALTGPRGLFAVMASSGGIGSVIDTTRRGLGAAWRTEDHLRAGGCPPRDDDSGEDDR